MTTRPGRASGGTGAGERASLIGSKVGSVRIVERLGAGGMGEVYVGFDETLRRKVALKAIAGRHRLSEAARVRFLREARMLSRLDHPNICRIYDFTEEADSEYLVLELIEGRDLGAAIAEGLGPKAKLRIARDIAGVLAAAHSEGVVHRDLKPGNVMLTPEGEIKVLDFGLALSEGKEAFADAEAAVAEDTFDLREPTALDERTIATRFASKEVTRTSSGDTLATVLDSGASAASEVGGPKLESLRTERGLVVGTPHFMSPEQARGEPVTSASDMYSFGLLIQSLFTGRSPYPDGLAVDRVLKLAERGTTVPLLGVDRDLAKLVERLKALAPASRPTAATALERLNWILDKPKRRVRRLAVAALLLLAALAGLKYTVDLSRERNLAVEARDVAEQRRGQAEDLIGFMLGDLRKKLEPVGRLEILDEVGEQAMDYFAAVPEEELSDEELLNRSKALYQIGEVRIAQGDLPAAEEPLTQSLALAAALSERNPDNGERLFALGQSHFWVGYVHWLQGDLESTLREYERYLDLSERLVEIDPSNLDWQLEVAYAHTNLGAVYEKQGNLEQALSSIRRSNHTKQELVGSNPNRVDWSRSLANGLSWLGATLLSARVLDESLATFQAELDIRERIVAGDPRNSDSAYLAAISHNHVGDMYLIKGSPQEALRHSRQAIERLQALVNLDPGNTDWLRELAVSQRLAGDALIENTGFREAREDYAGSARMLQELLQSDPTNADWRRELAQSTIGLARVQLAAREPAARNTVLAALALLSSEGQEGADVRHALAEAYLVLGIIEKRGGRPENARQAWLRSLETLELSLASTESLRALDYRAQALLLLDRREEAAPLVAELTEIGYAKPSFVDVADG